ncbi:transmembrane protease serine 9-like [Thomomys bottae]
MSPLLCCLFFHWCGATLLTKPPSLLPGSLTGLNSDQPVQQHLKHSELNISLAECRLGMVWKDKLQALWLFKTAIVSHETTECGLRPGLVPHCPNCWEAEIGEFPWMVSVQLSFSHFCAGSILNEQWILTSARCANFIKSSEALALVQVGLIDLQDTAQAQTVGIHRAMPYLGPTGPLGPGLIFLKQPINFQPLVLPICLEESPEQVRNIQLYDCWLPSWSLMRGSPGILQKRHLSILRVISCAQFWPTMNEFTFCVEAKKAMGEAGCKGDLGAPLVCHIQQKDTWVQVGILSHFDEHCRKPYVFSQVNPFIFWLQGVTRPSHAPWSQQEPLITSVSIALPVTTPKNASTFTSTTAFIQPHFISLPQPQTLADHISIRYTMPWQAMIISCGSQICSGSVLSSSWILTAAHCVRNMNPEDTIVILGLRHPGAPLRVVKVTTILLHERFRLVSGTARNDLALVLLQESQNSIQISAPLGHLKNLNNSECWLSGPQILKPGETDENPEILQMQVMGASNCAHLYPDIGSSIICFTTHAKGHDPNLEPVNPGSAVMCRPIYGNGKWRQIGFTSLKSLATIVSPHFSWIISTTEKAGHPLNLAVMPWMEKASSSCLLKHATKLLLSLVIIIVAQNFLWFK